MGLADRLRGLDARLLGRVRGEGADAWRFTDQLAERALRLGAGGVVALGVELVLRHDPVVSLVLLLFGVLGGLATGRALGARMASDLEDLPAPAASPSPATPRPAGALAVRAAVALLLLFVQLLVPTPTIVPGVLVALGLQAHLQRLGLLAAEAEQQRLAVARRAAPRDLVAVPVPAS